VLTKYDPINKEWASIGVKGDVPLAINDGISAYLSSRDVFITICIIYSDFSPLMQLRNT
jgi:hypothetical protein